MSTRTHTYANLLFFSLNRDINLGIVFITVPETFLFIFYSGAGIANEIFKEMKKRGVEPPKIMGLGSEV